MRRRDLLFGAAGVTGGLGLLSGSGAFSATQADREVTVEVVGDDEAYVELTDLTGGSSGEVISPTIEERHVGFLRVGNQFGTEIRVGSVFISAGSAPDDFDVSFEIPDGASNIEPGDSVEIEADVDAPDSGVDKKDIEFTIEIETTDGEPVVADATITRTLSVDIEEANVEEVGFRGGSSSGNGGENSGSGGGTIYVTIDGPADSLDADVWNDELEHASTSLEDGANPVKEIEIDQPVVAVRFPELDQLFVRDAFEPNECEFGDIQGSQTVEATDSGAFLECVEED